jgi:RNA polymerase sigma-70 factor, ECF subfamily
MLNRIDCISISFYIKGAEIPTLSSGLYYNEPIVETMMSDRELIQEIQNGNILAYEQLVCRYQRGLYVFVLRRVGNEHEAQEIVQDALYKVYQTIDRIDVERKFSTYVFEIAKNLAISFLRVRKPKISLDIVAQMNDDTSLYEAIAKKETRETVQKAVRQLPKNYRDVITLYYFRDLSYVEVGKSLGIPLNTVRTHLRRARKLLKQLL